MSNLYFEFIQQIDNNIFGSLTGKLPLVPRHVRKVQKLREAGAAGDLLHVSIARGGGKLARYSGGQVCDWYATFVQTAA